jgi:FAD dependent oxidoreductase
LVEVDTSFDVVVVGAGLVGSATALDLSSRHIDLRPAVVDKESGPGERQSGHNCGVLQAGVYLPGSWKVQLWVDGKQRMQRFADADEISYETCGKLIIAVEEPELAQLADLKEARLGERRVRAADGGTGAPAPVVPTTHWRRLRRPDGYGSDLYPSLLQPPRSARWLDGSECGRQARPIQPSSLSAEAAQPARH